MRTETDGEMTRQSVMRRLWLIYVICVAYTALFFAVGGDDILHRDAPSAKPDAASSGVIGEVTDGMVVEQEFTAHADEVVRLDVQIGTYERKNTGTLTASVYDETGTQVTKSVMNASELVNGVTPFVLDPAITDANGKTYTVRFETEGASAGNAATFSCAYGAEGFADLALNGEKQNNETLIMSSVSRIPDIWGKILLGMWAVLIVFFAGYFLYTDRKLKQDKDTAASASIKALSRYRFLMDQLVSRDFKVRYKRSVLGVMWSFINPILTMLVQFFVFSKVFRVGGANYIVYLLTGITFFNFYSESTNNGLLSIVGNASLIKKVYVPKYIYPVSKTLSSAINFGIAIILLFAVTLISGIPLTKYILLFPYAAACAFILNIGVSLIISTGMVFFHDVQFLYNVFMTLLSYGTPLFWYLSSMPEKYHFVFYMNPLCDIITFSRDCIMYGTFPGAQLSVLCLLIPVLILAAGVLIFRKFEDEFVLHI